VFRSPSMAQHAVAFINNQEWLSGGCDGTLQVGGLLGCHRFNSSNNSNTYGCQGKGCAAELEKVAPLRNPCHVVHCATGMSLFAPQDRSIPPPLRTSLLALVHMR
jgi:hypothetical protein